MRFTKRSSQIIGILALALTLVMAAFPASAGAASFNDIGNSPYKNAILWISGRGAMNGYNATTFGTNDPLLREQAAIVLARLRGWKPSSNTSTTCFNDLAGRSKEVAQTVCLMASYGVISGSNGSFRPGDQITQVDLLTLITRTMWASGLWPPSTPDPGYYRNIQGTQRPAVVMYAYMTGPVSGSPNIYGSLNNPYGGVSRGFGAQLIYQGWSNCGYVPGC